VHLRLFLFPVLALAAVPASVLSPPAAAGPHLVVAPPWRDAAKVVRAAGGVPAGPWEAPFAVLALSDDPSFLAQVRAAGGAVFDGRRLSFLCGVD
jgi:hypothetical protein